MPCHIGADLCGAFALTNTIAIILAIILIVAGLVDVFYFGTEHMIFLGKKLADLIEYIAFWR
ncbi:hypothetical protein [Sulfitobacter noctilucicola]|uniref:hypothetical protein n=1 Tax=Sulfitobacter noctilucicola TaxID=1342301 RepID=UPI0009DFB64E|nr:hypothetical protein [Sulfitobacter noctilucicola]